MCLWVCVCGGGLRIVRGFEEEDLLESLHSVLFSLTDTSNPYTAAWSSGAGDAAPWLGVHFETLVTVMGVTTTGGLAQQAWVTSYKLKYRFDSTAPLYWYSNPPGTGAKV